MQILDILFIIAAVFFVAVGIRRGLIGELFRLAALVSGFFIAFLYYQDFAGITGFFKVHPAYLRNAIAFSLIFLIVVLAVIGTGWLLKKIIHLTPLGWADSVFGGVLGLAKAVLIVWVICLSLSSFPQNRFVLNQRRSLVFETYKKLPPGMKLSGITGARNLFKKNTNTTMPQNPVQPAAMKIKPDTSPAKHR